MTPNELLERALAATYGIIAIPFVFWADAKCLRSALYKARNRARKFGNANFDNLSMVIRPATTEDADSELMIIPRNKILPPRNELNIASARPLSFKDLPTDVIRARGPHKPGTIHTEALERLVAEETTRLQKQGN